MELSPIANAVSNAASSAGTVQASALASLLLLRKTLDLQAANASSLLQALPAVSPPSNPPHLGNAIDVVV